MTIPTSGSKVEGSGLTADGPGSFDPPFRLPFFSTIGYKAVYCLAGHSRQFIVLADSDGSNRKPN